MQTLDETDFDLVVLGTGLVESVVAAAAAKAGRSVLQLDQGGHYGGDWATLHLDELLATLAAASAQRSPGSGVLYPPSPQGARVLQRPGAALGPPRAYSFDLAPKALYGVGPMIALLLGSGAHHYTEFKLVQGSYVFNGGQLQAVPSSRAEVFRDRSLSPLQKRTLMRFLKACTEAIAGEGPLGAAFDGRPFAELMRQEGLDEQLQRFLVHGVLLQQRGAEALPADQALGLLRRYVESAGRYGPGAGPLLTPVYGCGELPQAFCRVAAVAGAVQVLRCPVDGIGFDEHALACTGVELGNGQAIRCRHLAGGTAALRQAIHSFRPSLSRSAVHHCAAILDAPLRAGEQQSLVALPPGSLPTPSAAAGTPGIAVWGLCLGHSTAVCPPGRWILHLWVEAEGGGGEGESSAHAALEPALQALAECDGLVQRQLGSAPPEVEAADGEVCSGAEGGEGQPVGEEGEGATAGASPRPRVLLAAFFTTRSAALAGSLPGWPHNVTLCPGPGPEVTLTEAVGAAKRCYWALYPHAAAAPFPLDPDPDAAPAGPDSDEEALEALQSALEAPPGGAVEEGAAAAASDVAEAPAQE